MKAGKTIFVLYVTAGDGNDKAVRQVLHLPLVPASFIRLGFTRHQEGINAADFLGVPRNRLFFLCFPDTDTLKIALNPDPNAIVRSQKTHLTNAAYPFAFRKKAPYSRASEFRLVREVIEKVKPGTIIINRPEDTNPDHRAARILALGALSRSRLRPLVLSYLIHFPNWPGKGNFVPPLRLQKATIFKLNLTKQELARKHHAFQLHKTENLTSQLDRRLVRPAEFFWLGSNRII